MEYLLVYNLFLLLLLLLLLSLCSPGPASHGVAEEVLFVVDVVFIVIVVFMTVTIVSWNEKLERQAGGKASSAL